MTVEAFAQHLESPFGRGHVPGDACTGAAGGAACGDLVRVSLAVDRDSPQGTILDAGFDASGCGAAQAAGSATVALLQGLPLLEAARIGAGQISAELGGLSPAKRHAAELAADALHRALGLAAARKARLASTGRRTLVAMSGGVDSAVAALLTAEEGGEVAAVTLELWSDPHNDASRSCCSPQAVRYARHVAHDMGLAHLSIDLREEFKAGVVDGWLADHAAGLTPNPCVRCNGRVRIDAMIDLADRLGAETLATGHYARLVGGREAAPLLRVARDEAKDQSYALAALAPSSLARLRFPLGEMTKAQVRERAERAGLAVARRPDSQDLCFLAGADRSAFLARHGGLRSSPGAILDLDGRQLGRHEGLHTVTVGQRRGLGLGGGPPLFVLGVDPAANTVTVGPRERLLDERVSVLEATLHRQSACVDAVKLRYRGRRIPCRLAGALEPGLHDRVEVLLAQPSERTAAGQVACFYAGETVVGHGTVAARPAPGPPAVGASAGQERPALGSLA